jgi:hypothetical protein
LKQTLRCGGREKRVYASLFSPRSPPPRTDENDALLLLKVVVKRFRFRKNQEKREEEEQDPVTLAPHEEQHKEAHFPHCHCASSSKAFHQREHEERVLKVSTTRSNKVVSDVRKE